MIKFYIALLFLLFFPVLDISGHFISIPEFYLYGAVLLTLKDLKKNPFAPSYLLYFVGFFVVIMITSLLAQTSLNNHDLFTLRNCAQSICGFYLFDRWFRLVSRDHTAEQIYSFVLGCLLIATLPCILVFLQRVDFLGMRSIVTTLYKPQFHFLGSEQFAEFRYTSVFKDFFTFACYSILLCITQFFCLLKLPLKGKGKIFLFSLVLLTFMSQFYVARTSILFIPISLSIIFLMFPNKDLKGGSSRKMAIFLLIVPIVIISLFSLFYFNVVNQEWIRSGFTFLSDDPNKDSSFSVMQQWNIGFLQYLWQNPGLLFLPKHSYDLTVTANPALYTDSFYAQEIYRYGIYGAFIYLLFVIKLYRVCKKTHFALSLFVLCAVILNYKGGNVFMMHKNSYLYPFFFMLLIWVSRWDGFSSLKTRTSGEKL